MTIIIKIGDDKEMLDQTIKMVLVMAPKKWMGNFGFGWWWEESAACLSGSL